MIPHKRSKNHRILTAEQEEHSHLVNSTRVRVQVPLYQIENYVGLRIKSNGIMPDQDSR